MDSGIHILSSRLLAQHQNLTVIADNMANINTHGFKRLMYDYEQVTGRNEGKAVGDYTKGIGVVLDHSDGHLEKTDNPFDVALIGDGFLTVQGADGNPVYTRNGHFTTTSDGTLIDGHGRLVLDNGGAQILIPQDATQIRITEDGAITTEQGLLTQLNIVTFTPADKQQLQRVGNAGFAAPDGVAAQLATGTVTKQGWLESSNVNPVAETVRLQELNNAYQATLRSVRNIEQLEERAVRTLAAPPN